MGQDQSQALSKRKTIFDFFYIYFRHKAALLYEYSGIIAIQCFSIDDIY